MFDHIIGILTQFCARRFLLVIALCFTLSGIGTYYAVHHLKMDTDVSSLVSSREAWRQRVTLYQEKFPQFVDLLIVVVDATTPDMAREAANRLTEAAQARPDLFSDVRQPGAGPFFEQNGLLFLKIDELQNLINSIIKAQPFLASLAADPSLRGLFSTLDLALQGIANKATDAGQIIGPLEQIDTTIVQAFQGNKTPLSWQNMILSRKDDPRNLRRIILMRPYQDFNNLQPAKAGINYIREKAKELQFDQYGVKVRLTGNVALEAEEFATVAEGTGIALFFSVALVLGLLFLALRSWRPIFATFLTLVVGLLFTLTFASLAIGSLNLISVAFAVMFIGLSIDFGIQFGVAFNQHLSKGVERPFFTTGKAMARPLTLAAFAIAIGFLSFFPTDYRGVSELGLIAGAGMIITLILNLTLLPALLSILGTKSREKEMGYQWTRPFDHFLLKHRWKVIGAWSLMAFAGMASLSRLTFDFNPLHLKDVKSESVSTLYDLAMNKLNSPYPGIILAPGIKEAASLASELQMLPEVGTVITAKSFVPTDQEEKLAIIEDAAFLLEPSLNPQQTLPLPTTQEIRQLFKSMAQRLTSSLPNEPAALSLAGHLAKAAAKDDDFIASLSDQLLKGFSQQLHLLNTALGAQPVTLENLPESIRKDWIAPDSTAIIMALPKGNADNTEVLAQFVKAISSMTDKTSGPAVQIYFSARAIVEAFQEATIVAIIMIALLLFFLLRRVKDTLFVILPLAVAACGTALITYFIHLDLNYANIIALPLLLGIGVAFNVYFVVNWRRGIAQPLQTHTARAVLFSALTTAASFASLALSAHRGTASMGLLLLIGLGVVLATSFFFLPSLLGKPPVAIPPSPAQHS